MSRFSTGYVKTHRETVKGMSGRDLAVYVTLTCWACIYDSEIIWNNKKRTIKPGMALISVRGLADQLRMSKDAVFRSLTHLQNQDTIGYESSTRGILITIRNWEEISGAETCARQDRDADGDSIEELIQKKKNIRVNSNSELSSSSPIGFCHAKASPAFSLDQLWNKKVKNSPLSSVREVTTKRAKQIMARVNEISLQEWEEVIDRILASDFCRGKNDRGWRASFDWLLMPDTRVKVMEGKYDNPKRGLSAVVLPIFKDSTEVQGA